MIDDKTIQEKLVLGYSLSEIAHKYGLCYGTLRSKFKYVKKEEKYITDFKPNYYGYYSWESLSLEEKTAYLIYENKNKAYYEY